ncbi:hypothetical protein AALP_AAs45038U000100, partial [Arabis alpina]
AGLGKGGKPAQGQKRKWEGASGSGQSGRGYYICGSLDHQRASCPKRSEVRGVRTCYQCGESGHIRPNCPKLQPLAVAVVQPVAQYGPVQPLDQIAAMERPPAIAAPGEPSSRPITGTLFVGGCESHVLFHSGASNCFITPDHAERSGIRSDAGERTGPVMVAGGEFLAMHGRAKEVDILVAGELMPADLVISPVELYDVIL